MFPSFHLKIETFDLLKLRWLEIVDVVADNFVEDVDDEVAFSLVASEEDEVVNPWREEEFDVFFKTRRESLDVDDVSNNVGDEESDVLRESGGEIDSLR